MSLRVSMSSWLISACSGDMYSNVPTILPKPVTNVLSVSACPAALATPKSITLGTGLPSYRAARTVGRFRCGGAAPLLCRGLPPRAEGGEQLQPLPGRQLVLVAVARDRHPFHQVHDEVRPA